MFVITQQSSLLVNIFNAVLMSLNAFDYVKVSFKLRMSKNVGKGRAIKPTHNHSTIGNSKNRYVLQSGKPTTIVLVDVDSGSYLYWLAFYCKLITFNVINQ